MYLIDIGVWKEAVGVLAEDLHAEVVQVRLEGVFCAGDGFLGFLDLDGALTLFKWRDKRVEIRGFILLFKKHCIRLFLLKWLLQILEYFLQFRRLLRIFVDPGLC